MSQKSEKMEREDMLRGDLVGGRGYREGPSSGWMLVEEPTGCRMVFFSYILLPAQLSQTPGRRRLLVLSGPATGCTRLVTKPWAVELKSEGAGRSEQER